MPIVRTLAAAALTVVVGAGALSVAPAQAEVKLPKREITQKRKQVDFSVFKFTGKIENPQADGVTMLPYVGKFKLKKKACNTCKFKTVKKLKTNDQGKFKTKIYAPKKGRWKWRIVVPSSEGYAKTEGTAFFTGYH